MQPRDLYLLLAALSFLPPLAFLLWVRMDERHRREPILPLLGLFLYSGTLGVALAIGLTALTGGRDLFWAAVVVAPLAEELSKALGLGFVRRHMEELEDGIVHGVALGVGFAATENFLYGASEFLDNGSVGAAAGVVAARVFSSMLLHACSTALVGFGYAAAVLRQGVAWQALPFFLVAVALHALYNLLVLGGTWTGFLAAVAMVVAVTVLLRRRIRALDARSRPVA